MKIRTLVTAAALLIGVAGADVPGLEVKGPYASIKRNKDGSYEEFSRTQDMRVITKKTKGPDHSLRLTTVYRLSVQGNPLTCDIFDGKGTRLFKSRYGYDPKPGLTYGKLVEEQMFDARVKRTDPKTGKEMPVRRFLYTYDAQGNRQAPIAITTIPGKTADDVFGPSALEFDPFDGQTPESAPVNPRSKPVGER
ncbi:hypothetical protein [Luteolibacter marinus]|uniref:hypothetical protein n=1 Tax=Luteolibacter marinus TaxID=2776705 RepID=UPI001865F23B|nr:hypothetical protein [Luteolibacter marinus]